jgi:hypothetical protein
MKIKPMPKASFTEQDIANVMRVVAELDIILPAFRRLQAIPGIPKHVKTLITKAQVAMRIVVLRVP